MVFAIFPLFLVAAMVIGIILIVRGIRGVPEFSEPHCRKCNYDVRMLDWSREERVCPECGSDLTQPKAVRFGNYRKRPKMIWSGAGLCALPLVLIALVVLQQVLGIRWQNFESNASIIANLSNTADSPWDWRKLEDRYDSGKLSDREVAAAIDQLIAHLAKKNKPHGPLHWADDFFELALENGHISEEQLQRLAEAYYGSEPTLRMRDRIAEGKPVQIEVQSMNSWDLPGLKHVMAVREVRAGDKSIEMNSRYENNLGMDAFSGGSRSSGFEFRSGNTLAPGGHELTLVFDWGLLVENAPSPPKLNGRPGQKEHWPKPIMTRSIEVKRKLEVVPEGESVIALVTDPERDPSESFSIPKIQVFPYGEQLQLETKIQVSEIEVAVSARLFLDLEGVAYELGTYTREGGRSSYSSQRRVDHLPKDLTRIDVRMEPDTKLALEQTTANEIWGEPILIRNVLLERFDVNEDAQSTP